jgi:diguanylate cyclase (GGDEF)-like protein
MNPDAAAFDRAPAPMMLAVNPRAAAAFGALVLATLLVGLFVYRRRPYILQWSAGWLLIAAALALLARDWTSVSAGRAAVGLSQLLHLLAALVFVTSADSFRQRPHVNWRWLWYLGPVILWFSLAPLALGVKAALAPGYLLTTAMYAAAAVAYLILLGRTRLVGAGAIGISFLMLAGVDAWLGYAAAVDASRWNAQSLAALMPAGLIVVLAGLGMHILVFEDLGWELRQTNRRLEAAHRDLEQLVVTDALTGCHNRRFFLEVIRREYQRHRRYNTRLSVLFVDVDCFKAVNDTRGHEAGDAALRQVADFLRAHVREADYLFRWGGDEFLALLTCGIEEAERKARELQRAFAATIRRADYPPGFGLSIGAAEIRTDRPEAMAAAMAAIKEADERMYLEKTRARA